MSNKISLEKRQATLKLSLEKASVEDKIKLRVGAALDISGSMNGLYRNGDVSDFVGKLIPFGLTFDDNGELDMWAFDHGSQELPVATAKVYDDYVGKCMSGISISGGTAYAPVMQDIYNEYFGNTHRSTKTVMKEEERPSGGFLGKLFGKKEVVQVPTKVVEFAPNTTGLPAVVFFLTDGENSDVRATRQLLEQNRDTPVYWFMVGLGRSRFDFLRDIADEYPNVDFISIDDLKLSDEALYSKLLAGEFGQWANKHGVSK